MYSPNSAHLSPRLQETCDAAFHDALGLARFINLKVNIGIFVLRRLLPEAVVNSSFVLRDNLGAETLEHLAEAQRNYGSAKEHWTSSSSNQRGRSAMQSTQMP